MTSFENLKSTCNFFGKDGGYATITLENSNPYIIAHAILSDAYLTYKKQERMEKPFVTKDGVEKNGKIDEISRLKLDAYENLGGNVNILQICETIIEMVESHGVDARYVLSTLNTTFKLNDFKCRREDFILGYNPTFNSLPLTVGNVSYFTLIVYLRYLINKTAEKMFDPSIPVKDWSITNAEFYDPKMTGNYKYRSSIQYKPFVAEFLNIHKKLNSLSKDLKECKDIQDQINNIKAERDEERNRRERNQLSKGGFAVQYKDNKVNVQTTNKGTVVITHKPAQKDFVKKPNKNLEKFTENVKKREEAKEAATAKEQEVPKQEDDNEKETTQPEVGFSVVVNKKSTFKGGQNQRQKGRDKKFKHFNLSDQ